MQVHFKELLQAGIPELDTLFSLLSTFDVEAQTYLVSIFKFGCGSVLESCQLGVHVT